MYDAEAVIEKTKLEVFEILKKSVRPEFLNRIDETIMFRPLTEKDIESIVKIQINLLQKRLKTNDIKISITDEAVKTLAHEGYDPQFGARPVKRVIQKSILNELSKELLKGDITTEDEIVIDSFEGLIVFRKK